jgi:hypothetical protein
MGWPQVHRQPGPLNTWAPMDMGPGGGARGEGMCEATVMRARPVGKTGTPHSRLFLTLQRHLTARKGGCSHPRGHFPGPCQQPRHSQVLQRWLHSPAALAATVEPAGPATYRELPEEELSTCRCPPWCCTRMHEPRVMQTSHAQKTVQPHRGLRVLLVLPAHSRTLHSGHATLQAPSLPLLPSLKPGLVAGPSAGVLARRRPSGH